MRARHARPIHSASVLLPTWQGIEFLADVLDALAAQRTALPFDVHVVDSGSDDGTWELLRERQAGFPVPLRIARIHPTEFDHGDTRNLLAARSSGDLLVFLTQDAVPSSPDWLALLGRNFDDPRVGAAYCRNVPRADAPLVTRLFCRGDPGYAPERLVTLLPPRPVYDAMSTDERRLLFNFNDVASAVRRELWERHPFPRTMMGEDVLIARAIVEAGYATVYDAEATVDHSHDYGPEKMHWRGEVDARFNAEWLGRLCIASEADLAVLTEQLLADDEATLAAMDVPAEEIERQRDRAASLRAAFLRGLYDGSQATRRYAPTVMRERPELRLLFVTDGFPPESTEPSALHALGLARELARRGHEVSVLARSPIPGEEPDWSLRRDEVEGLVVLRATLSAPPRAFVDADHWTRAEATFQSVLACVDPEVVHFQGVRHGSPELVRIARERGIATLVRCDDGFALGPDAREFLTACAAADQCVTAERARRERYLETGELDPRAFVWLPRRAEPSDDERRAIAEEALEMEFRYRALACIDRSPRPPKAPLLDAVAAEADVRGPTTSQDAGWVLLRPGSAATFPLRGLPAGRVEVRVEQFALAAERDVALGGRVLVDGREVGFMEPLGAPEEDRALVNAFECALPRSAREITLEPFLGQEDAALHMRLCRLRITEAANPNGAARARATPPPADLAALTRRLRVNPGPRPETARLPRVAVVIPTLGAGPVLEDSLASVAALDYPAERLEVLIVDNGSRDGSLERARRAHPRVRVLEQARNLGFAAACNAGARAAAGTDVIAFLNDDVRVEPGFLRELVSPLARGECSATAAKLLSWDGSAIDTSGTGTTFAGIAVQPGYGQPPRPEHDVPRKTLFPCGAAMAVDARAFAEVGGFDPEYFAYYEDLDLGWRMWVLGHSVHYVPSAVGYHHHSLTSRRLPAEAVRLVMVRNSLYTCVKNYDDENLARVLPVVLSLAIRRAWLKSSLDERPLRIEDAGLGAGAPSEEARCSIAATGAADLLAINDLLGRWDHWMRRRFEVQSRRKRPDHEIQPLFLEPLACVEADPSYRALQESLVALFRLDETFRRS